jgi:GxxExxY protein
MDDALNRLSGRIIGCAVEVHRTLGGPGLLESVYEEALAWELQACGLCVERQVEIPIVYKGQKLATPLRLDMLVEHEIIVENKATVTYNTIFEAQALTYLRLSNLRLALIINFGEKQVTHGVHRVINGFGI